MISAVVLTKNGEQKLRSCLESLRWCDEILVIDDGSTDNSVKLAKSLGAKVLGHELAGDFARQRNFGLQKAQGDWVLFVDDDERVNSELAAEIQREIKSETPADGYFFKRIDFFGGRWLKHGEIGQIRLLRLARKEAGKWTRPVDEVWEISGETKAFKYPLLHYSHSNLTEFLETINQRSSLNALVFYQEGKKVNLWEWLKPLAKFWQGFIWYGGWRDGVPGFVFAVLMSLHSFLVRGKLYLLWRRQGGWNE